MTKKDRNVQRPLPEKEETLLKSDEQLVCAPEFSEGCVEVRWIFLP